MKSVISLGPINISLYSLCILVGIILAFILIRKESKRFNIKDDFISNLIFWCVIYGIVGARIYYVLFNLDYYMHSPIEMCDLRDVDATIDLLLKAILQLNTISSIK